MYMSNNQLDDLNDLVEELKTTKNLTGVMSPPDNGTVATQPETITETNIDDFIFRKSAIIIQQGVDTLEGMKRTVYSGANAETVEAYAKLMSSVAGSIEILNKINLQKRKEKAAKELKQMDVETSKKLLDKYNGPPSVQNQTNILVASREDIMKAILSKADDIIEQLPDAVVNDADR